MDDDKERNKLRQHAFRARQYGKPAEFTLAEWKRILAARTYCCYCHGPLIDPELEHIVPLSDADSPWHVSHNVTVSCASCNRKKHTETWSVDPVQLKFVFTST